ncbi:SWIM zinc finger family protein [soil metagenome]
MSVPESSSARASWLQSLDAEDLRGLIEDAAARFPTVGDWLDLHRASSTGDPAELLATVNRTLTPHRRFYDYRQANEYADDGLDTVELLAGNALQATPALIPVIERAITLATRAILKSDDSSGAQGGLVRTLLDAHATATRTATPTLTQPEQTRLVAWIVKYRYSGTQDFFDPDIVAYAPGLSQKSIEKYRQAIADTDLGRYGSYPLTRLAVLDQDRDAIITANGGEPHNAMVAARIVSDLDEAGLRQDAIAYAHTGIAMDAHGWDPKLVTFLVDDALTRGDLQQAVTLRRDWFERFPTSRSFTMLRDTAEQAGLWTSEKEAAEQRLAKRDAPGFTSYLLEDGRDNQAWEFATLNSNLIDSAALWLSLCDRRAQSHPLDTLPIYRRIITDTLTVTDKRNYRSAATMLKTMRTVATSAGHHAVTEFDTFLAETIDRNRRRPTCIDAFTRAGLIPRR